MAAGRKNTSVTRACVHSPRCFLSFHLGAVSPPRVADVSPLVAVEGAAVVGEEEAVTQAVAERQGGLGGGTKAGLRAVELRR